MHEVVQVLQTRVQDVQTVVQDVHRHVQDVHRHVQDVQRLVQDVDRSVTAVDGLMHAVTKSVLRGKLLHLGKKILATRVAFEKIRGQMKTILS